MLKGEEYLESLERKSDALREQRDKDLAALEQAGLSNPAVVLVAKQAILDHYGPKINQVEARIVAAEHYHYVLNLGLS
jgi:hypothetical protein